MVANIFEEEHAILFSCPVRWLKDFLTKRTIPEPKSPDQNLIHLIGGLTPLGTGDVPYPTISQVTSQFLSSNSIMKQTVILAVGSNWTNSRLRSNAVDFIIQCETSQVSFQAARKAGYGPSLHGRHTTYCKIRMSSQVHTYLHTSLQRSCMHLDMVVSSIYCT